MNKEVVNIPTDLMELDSLLTGKATLKAEALSVVFKKIDYSVLIRNLPAWIANEGISWARKSMLLRSLLYNDRENYEFLILAIVSGILDESGGATSGERAHLNNSITKIPVEFDTLDTRTAVLIKYGLINHLGILNNTVPPKNIRKASSMSKFYRHKALGIQNGDINELLLAYSIGNGMFSDQKKLSITRELFGLLELIKKAFHEKSIPEQAKLLEKIRDKNLLDFLKTTDDYEAMQLNNDRLISGNWARRA